MKLSKDEIALLRSLVEWRRANGWSHQHRREDFLSRHQWRNGPYVLDLHVDAVTSLWLTRLKATGGGSPRNILRPKSVGQAVDVLVALAVLPMTFSSAFRAGRESAYTTDEWRAVFDAVDGPRNWFQPVDDKTIAEKVLADCRKYYDDAYLQRRRTGATGWEKVADA